MPAGYKQVENGNEYIVFENEEGDCLRYTQLFLKS